ncbi:MAG: FUSC family membrane protein [Bacteroidota bacterium]
MIRGTEYISSNLTASSRILKRFLYSQYFSDGLRITFGVLIPSIILYQFGHIEIGIALSLGALSISIPDTPGPYQHRRNAMLITCGVVFTMAVLTGLLSKFPLALGCFIGLCCFGFSMLNVFGARAASIGISALIILILGIDQNHTPTETIRYAGILLAGGLWYFVLSLATQKLMPYRAAEQVLGECIIRVAEFLKLKGGFYDPETDIKEQYKKILDQQVVVNEYQEQAREILFKTRQIMTDSTPTGRRLLLTFIDLVDLYDQTMATHYNYEVIREQYAKTGVLSYFNQVIVQVAEELEHIGLNIHNHTYATPVHQFGPKLALLKQKLDETELQYGVSTHMLKRVLINLRNIAARLDRVYEYKNTLHQLPEQRSRELVKFTVAQDYSFKLLRANLTKGSTHFRHAIRLAFICVSAFAFVRFLYQAQYSYWILLTILVILKPGFSLTKKRNYERVAGTIAGGVIGLLVLKYFHSVNERFIILTIFMVLAFSFMRVRYIVSVLFMTPYVLIVFSFTGNDNGISVAWERIMDTLIGAGAAFAASYFVFPSWESYQLKTVMRKMIEVNLAYLKAIIERDETPATQSAYRLARKEVYVQTANLTTAFQRMLSEPKSKQVHVNEIYSFTVLNNQLSSYLATLSDSINLGESLTDEQKKWIRSVYFTLNESINAKEAIKRPYNLLPSCLMRSITLRQT